MRYGIEVRVSDGFDPATGAPRYTWKRVRPTGGSPYTWDTHAEADSMRRMCYPETTADDCRIVEVKE